MNWEPWPSAQVRPAAHRYASQDWADLLEAGVRQWPAPLQFSKNLYMGAEIGVILLLFMLGLEYTGEELQANLRSGFAAGAADLVLNAPPGIIAGWLWGWSPLASILLGGVTYISSSGIIARVLAELGRMDNPETPTVLSILVMEDLAMAIFLPLVAVLLIGQGIGSALISWSLAP